MSKDWFTSIGTPKRDNNQIAALVDGEESWTHIAAAIKRATKTIHMTWWMMALDHELLRPDANTFKEPADRILDRLGSILMERKNAGVVVRVLLWSWKVAGSFPSAVLDMVLHEFGKLGIFEVMYENHPNTLGSWHQKTLIVDGKIAFVGGMNTRENDWDTSAHRVFDYRRSPYKSSAGERMKWQADKEATQYKPRHDLMTEIVGPLVTDVEANFVQRWNEAKKQGVDYSGQATQLPAPSLVQGAGSITGQIARTMPATYPPVPAGEQGILDVYVKAIRNAETYIYIEDQYFRAQKVAQELAAAMQANKKLIVIVVAPPDYWYTAAATDDETPSMLTTLYSPTSYWTEKAFNTIRAVNKDFVLFYLQVSDTGKDGKQVVVPINVHAKIMIVDDLWYTIGSCNLNDRGFFYEGEINVAVLDSSAKDLRKRLFGEHLQTACPDDMRAATKLWFQHANDNLAAVKAATAPKSRPFAYAQGGPALPVVPPDWM